MTDATDHIKVEDEQGNYVGPAESNKGNCFSSMVIPRKGDTIRFDDREGEWEVLTVIHTLCTSAPREPITLKVRKA
jgi:hypothetical protein